MSGWLLRTIAAVACAVAASAVCARELVVIDAGHGGVDPGAVNRWGLREKDVNLAVAKRLAEYLRKNSSAAVVMTRKGDQTLTLAQRSKIGNSALKPNDDAVFVSLHCNSASIQSARGIETYIHNNKASDARARRLAARENMGVKGNGHSFIMLDMSNKLHGPGSILLAKQVHNEALRRARAHDRRVRQAPFYVLFYTQMPSILVELGFLSNAEEQRSLRSASYQQTLAESIGRGVIQYFAVPSTMRASR